MVDSRSSERLVDVLCREVGRFEEKVSNLEEKCRQILVCISALSEKLRTSCDFLPQGGERRGCADGMAPAGMAALCGIADHAEQALSSDTGDSCPDLIVHEPDERIIYIDGRLSECGPDGTPTPEMLRAGMARLEAVCPPGAERADFLRILSVPVPPDPETSREALRKGVVIACPSDLLSILGSVALRWLTFACGQKARAVVDQGQDLVDVMSAFIADFTEAEKQLCGLVNDCALSSRHRERDGAVLHA